MEKLLGQMKHCSWCMERPHRKPVGGLNEPKRIKCSSKSSLCSSKKTSKHKKKHFTQHFLGAFFWQTAISRPPTKKSSSHFGHLAKAQKEKGYSTRFPRASANVASKGWRESVFDVLPLSFVFFQKKTKQCEFQGVWNGFDIVVVFILWWWKWYILIVASRVLECSR